MKERLSGPADGKPFGKSVGLAMMTLRKNRNQTDRRTERNAKSQQAFFQFGCFGLGASTMHSISMPQMCKISILIQSHLREQQETANRIQTQTREVRQPTEFEWGQLNS